MRLRALLTATDPGRRIRAPRLLSVALIALAAVLVPWIGLLIAFNPTTATAFHMHLVTGGLGAAATAASGLAALGVRRRAIWTTPAAVAGFVLTAGSAIGMLVVTPASWTHLTPIGVACAAALFLTTRRAVGAAEGHGPHPGPALAVACGLAALALAAATAFYLVDEPRQFEAIHVRLAWVWLDVAELAALLGAGLALRRDDPRRAVLAGTAGATLLLADAWVNVTIVETGWPLVAAIGYAIVGELPSAALCAWAARAGLRALPQPVPPPAGASADLAG